MPKKRIGISLIALLGSVIGLFSSARALTVLQLNLEQLTALSEKVFVGRCVSVVPERDSAGRSVIDVTYDVEEMLKGDTEKRITFRQLGTLGGEGNPRMEKDATIAGIERDLPRYEVGEESVVFLSEDGRLGLTAPVALSQGKFEVMTRPSGEKTVSNGLRNRGLFIGSAQSTKLKTLSLSSKEKGLLKTNGEELPYEPFLSLVKKLAIP